MSADQAVEGDTRVRVWSDPGRLPLPPEGGDWGVRDVELVPGADRLPVLVLRRLRPDAPLTLHLDDAPGAAATVLIDRVLYRGFPFGRGLGNKGELSDPSNRRPDAGRGTAGRALRAGPAPALDGVRVDWQEEGGPVRHVARLRLGTDLVRGPSVLDLTYLLKPGQTERVAIRETLRPPLLAGDPRQAPTRWEVFLPPGEVALAPEDGGASRWTVALYGWLLTPRLAVTGGDLERWFAGPDVAPRVGAWSPDHAPTEAAVPSLVCWQDSGDPLVVASVPQWAWLLACSLPLLLLGVFLFTMARQAHAGRPCAAFWFWLTIVLLIPAAAAVWVFRPTLMYAIAYGCEPGATVLLLALAFQWVLLERYRRQIVFLPSFRRCSHGVFAGAGTTAAAGRPANRPPWTPRASPAAVSSPPDPSPYPLPPGERVG